jgi:hypothetical protein
MSCCLTVTRKNIWLTESMRGGFPQTAPTSIDSRESSPAGLDASMVWRFVTVQGRSTPLLRHSGLTQAMRLSCPLYACAVRREGAVPVLVDAVSLTWNDPCTCAGACGTCA